MIIASRILKESGLFDWTNQAVYAEADKFWVNDRNSDDSRLVGPYLSPSRYCTRDVISSIDVIRRLGGRFKQDFNGMWGVKYTKINYSTSLADDIAEAAMEELAWLVIHEKERAEKFIKERVK